MTNNQGHRVFLSALSRRSRRPERIADGLNAQGIHTGWSRPWSASAVRGKMQEIESQLDLRDQMAAEDAAADAFRPPMNRPGRVDADSAATSSPLVLSSRPEEPDDRTAAVTLSEDDRKAEEELRKDPLSGMFSHPTQSGSRRATIRQLARLPASCSSRLSLPLR